MGPPDAPLTPAALVAELAGVSALPWEDRSDTVPSYLSGLPGAADPHAEAALLRPTLAEAVAGSRDARGRDPAVVRADGVERLANAHATVGATLLVVDGALWSSRDVSEPCLRVTHGDETVIFVGVPGKVKGQPPSTALRADRIDDARALAAALLTPRPGNAATERGRVVVHRPDLLAFDDALALAEWVTAPFHVTMALVIDDGQVRAQLDGLRALAADAAPRDAAWTGRVLDLCCEASDALSGYPTNARGSGMAFVFHLAAHRWRAFDGDRHLHGPADPDVATFSP